MPTSDLYLYADRAQIEQVLINLLKNARETCERRTDKNIEIKFFSKGNPTFTISDNGEGILPDVLRSFLYYQNIQFRHRIEPVQTDHDFT